MLSILESNLDEERNEVVAAASIRSLAELITLMSDCDKLPQCIQRLTQLLLRGHPSDQFAVIADLGSVTANRQLATPDDKGVNSVRPTFTATLEWLLPSVAQWCLELDSLHTALIDPWLDHVDNYLMVREVTSGCISLILETVSVIRFCEFSHFPCPFRC